MTDEIRLSDVMADTISAIDIQWPNEDKLTVAACGWGGFLQIWQIKDAAQSILPPFQSEEPLLSLKFSETRNAIVFGGADGNIYDWAWETGEPEIIDDVKAVISSVRYTVAWGKESIISTDWSGQLRVY